MKILALITIGFALMVGLYSCQCDGCKYLDHRCEVRFKNFADSLVTNVTLKRYKKNSNFGILWDSTAYTTEATQEVNPATNQFEYTGKQFAFTGDTSSEYIIVLPNREEFKVTDLFFYVQECSNCAKKYYFHTFKSYRYGNVIYEADRIEFYR